MSQSGLNLMLKAIALRGSSPSVNKGLLPLRKNLCYDNPYSTSGAIITIMTAFPIHATGSNHAHARSCHLGWIRWEA